jgi:hypothetical protein
LPWACSVIPICSSVRPLRRIGGIGPGGAVPRLRFTHVAERLGDEAEARVAATRFRRTLTPVYTPRGAREGATAPLRRMFPCRLDRRTALHGCPRACLPAMARPPGRRRRPGACWASTRRRRDVQHAGGTKTSRRYKNFGMGACPGAWALRGGSTRILLCISAPLE